ncbi:hypothetical protein [Spirillospora sp. NPDC047279]|uniref:hypothetical protein n=1 Tax=Spirillospora sp. NPDC047279 TaxID=3155478 RepID=UPI0033E0202D
MRGASLLPFVLPAFVLMPSGCAVPAGADGTLRPSGTYTPMRPGGHARPGAAPGPRAGTPAGATAVPAAGTVLSAYRRYHQVVAYTLRTNDPARVSEVAAGAEARRLNGIVRAHRRAGLIQRAHADPHPRVTALRPPAAQVADCVTTSGPETFRARTGARVGRPARPRRHLLRATLRLTGGTWKVVKLTEPRAPRC